MSTTATAATAKWLRTTGYPLLTKTTSNPYATTGKWLLGVSCGVISMIHIGGITRLTQSGLSMTNWSLSGSFPPWTHEAWQLEFQRYQQFPEYQQRKSMSLSDFKYIYYWEYGHRMLGRIIGIAFVVPWMYFSFRRKIPIGYQPRMALLGSMGLSQGLVGWWMVQSGLGEDRRGDKREIRVKPIRLATHLSMALATYGALIWTGMDILKLPHSSSSNKAKQLLDTVPTEMFRHASKIRTGAVAVTALTAVAVVSGALVAGNDAGRAYNTFPQMDGAWIPPTLWKLSPRYRNVIENTATVQWNHRLLGTLTATSGLGLAIFGLTRGGSGTQLLTPQVRKGLVALGVAVTGQFALGVSALLTYVPLSLAAAHQMGSVVVFTSGLYLVHALKYARPGALLRSRPIVPKVAAIKPPASA